MKKALAILVGMGAAFYLLFAVVGPITYSFIYSEAEHDEMLGGLRTRVFMLGEWKSGRFSIREYAHYVFKDGFEREFGQISYGYGKALAVEMSRRIGEEFRVERIYVDDGEIIGWKHTKEDFKRYAWVVEESRKSIMMGRKRIALPVSGTPG